MPKETKMPKKKVKAEAAPSPASPLDEIRSFVQEQKQLYHALELAQKRVAQMESELETARHDLAEAESQRLMRASPDELDAYLSSDGSAESNLFVQASLRLEEARAALGGVTRRIREKDVEILSVSERLKAFREAYNQDAVSRFLTDIYEPAATVFALVLRRAAALEDALGVQIPEVHRLPDYGAWREDEEAMAIHKEHVPARLLAESLEEFRRDAEGRILVAERNRRNRAGFDPSARYMVRQAFRCYGKPYEVGQIVDRHTIDLKLLAQLYGSRRLQLLEPKEEWTQ
jgi:hypothetical protein